MERFSVCILLLFSSIALADFYRPEEVPTAIKPLGFDRGRSAAVQILGTARGCSGTLVSNSGHVLTALHCLPECYTQIKNNYVKSFRYLAPRTDHIVSQKEACTLDISQEGRSLGKKVIGQTVAAGAGYVEASDFAALAKEIDGSAAKRDAFVQAMRAGIGISGDFIVLHIPKLAGKTCAPLMNRAAVAGEQIWDISYPARSKRSDNLGTKGNIAVFSAGTVERAMNTQANYDIRKGSEAGALLVRRPGIVVNNIDSNEGSSGAGLLTNRGELLGVLNASGVSLKDMSKSFRANAYRDANGKWVHTNGNRYAVSADYIRNYVGAVYGAAVVDSAFNCQ